MAILIGIVSLAVACYIDRLENHTRFEGSKPDM